VREEQRKRAEGRREVDASADKEQQSLGRREEENMRVESRTRRTGDRSRVRDEREIVQPALPPDPRRGRGADVVLLWHGGSKAVGQLAELLEGQRNDLLDPVVSIHHFPAGV